MNSVVRALLGSAQAEFIQLSRARSLVALTVVQAITFLFLVSLFGMTGARAPTALIDYDKGMYAQTFVDNLRSAHHSFTVIPMDEGAANKALQHGNLVAMIVIPAGFSDAISGGQSIPLKVIVDNIDTDMTDDIQRALPSAVIHFAKQLQLPGIHVQVAEQDLIDHDTDFIPYLVVSSLVLAAFTISGILSAVAVAREYETGTAAMLALAPVHPIVPLVGRVLATCVVAIGALAITCAVAILGYGIVPKHPFEMAGALCACVLIFGCIGVALGAGMKRTLPVASLVFGIALPLFMFSGSYEPERFDGNTIWTLAHFSPVYYAVGIVEHAAYGLIVTPESVELNFLYLAGWAVASLLIATIFIRRGITA
jgi:ABC-2 type transport system permease protein